MKFFILVVSCLAVAKASSIWAHGHHHGAVVGASGVVTAHGASGPSGVVTGHGAVGPHGVHNDHVGHVGHIFAHGHDDGQWHGEGLLESQDWAGHHHGVHGAHFVAPHVVSHHGIVHGHAAVVATPAIFAHGHHGSWVGHHHW